VVHSLLTERKSHFGMLTETVLSIIKRWVWMISFKQ